MRTALALWKSFGPVLAALAIGCLLPSQAAAQVVYHTGEDAFDVADLSDDVLDAIAEKMGVPAEEKPAMRAALAGQKVGYKCQIFGLLWAYFAWWDCEPIMFKWADSETFEFMPLDPAKISDPDDKALAGAITEAFEKKAGGKKFAEAYSMSDANMGVWKRHGRFVLGGVILLLIVLAVLRKRKAQSGAPVAPQG
jgi:hypothetical protein